MNEPDDVVYWKNGSRVEDNGWKDRLQRDWDVNNSNNGDGGEELKIPPKLNDFPISVLSSWLQLSKRHMVQVIMSSMRNNDNLTDVLPTLEQMIVYPYQQQMSRLQLLTESHASSSVKKETFDMYIRILKSFHLSNSSANVDGVLSQVSSQVLSTLVSLRLPYLLLKNLNCSNLIIPWHVKYDPFLIIVCRKFGRSRR